MDTGRYVLGETIAGIFRLWEYPWETSLHRKAILHGAEPAPFMANCASDGDGSSALAEWAVGSGQMA